jgi:hypothetical protein
MAKRNGGIIGPDNVPSGMFGSAGGVWRLEDAFNYQKAGTWPVVLGYQIPNSLRFDVGSSDYLSRTPSSAGDTQKWTYSVWIKRSKLATTSGEAFELLSASPSGGGVEQIFLSENNILSYYYADPTLRINLVSNSVFRDVSAWYHIVIAVDTTQATASNRVRIYVNGSEITFSTATYPPQNQNTYINGTNLTSIGSQINAGSNNGVYFSGYMSEIYFINNQQLTPSSFGQTDSTTGIWTPIAYTGTYGTNGFYLKFANSASLGTDSSGNGNNFTVNNLTSVDQSTDTPTNNFPTLNALCAGSGLSLTEGNLKAAYSGSDAYKTIASTFGVTKGKWYWEHKIGSDTTYQLFGITTENNIFDARNTDVMTNFKTSYCWLAYATEARSNTTGGAYSSITYGTSLTGGDIVGCALDLDNNKIWWSKNGTWQNSGDPVAGTGQAFTIASSSSLGFAYFPMVIVLETASGIEISFGNASFTIASGNADANGFGNFEYAVPSGYYALCSKNLALYG